MAYEYLLGGSREKMANIKSSAKRAALSAVANERNKAARSLMKTNLKKFDSAISEGNREEAEAAFKVAAKTVDRAATKNLIHRNKAARRKSIMMRQLNTLEG